MHIRYTPIQHSVLTVLTSNSNTFLSALATDCQRLVKTDQKSMRTDAIIRIAMCYIQALHALTLSILLQHFRLAIRRGRQLYF